MSELREHAQEAAQGVRSPARPLAARVVTGTMMAVAATSPMNGLRVGPGFRLNDVLLVVAAIALACEWATARERPDQPPLGIRMGLAAIVAGGCLGTAFAADPLSSARTLALLGLSTAPILLVARWAPDLATLQVYAWCWIAGAVVSGLSGLLGDGDASGRPAGLMAHPNQLAMVAAMGLGLALAFVVWAPGRARWMATGASTVLIVTIVRTGSRAGLVAAAVVTVVIAVRMRGAFSKAIPRRRIAIAFVAIAALVTVVLAATEVHPLGRHNAVKRSLGDPTSVASDHQRLSSLESELQGIADRPMTGSGFEDAPTVHNVYVQLLAAGGLLGLLGFLLVGATTLRAGLRSEVSDPRQVITSAFVSGYAAYLVVGTVQNFLWDRYLWLHAAVILWAGRAGDPPAASREGPATARRSCDAGMGTLGIGSVGDRRGNRGKQVAQHRSVPANGRTRLSTLLVVASLVGGIAAWSLPRRRSGRSPSPRSRATPAGTSPTSVCSEAPRPSSGANPRSGRPRSRPPPAASARP